MLLLYYFNLSANRNELAAILWLNGLIGGHEGDELRIFDSLAADCLFGQGTSFYPSVHPEFLSKGGDLSINISERCGGYHSEAIPRRANRLVVLRDRMPFFFNTVAENEDPAMVVVVHFTMK
jgi:hypothetical protein